MFFGFLFLFCYVLLCLVLFGLVRSVSLEFSFV